MRGSLGIDIVKGVGVLVFVNFLGGNFPADNLAEQAIFHETFHSLRLETRRTTERMSPGRGRRVPNISDCSRNLQCGRWCRAHAHSLPALRFGLIESYQENRALRGLSIVRNLFGEFAIVIVHPYSHPPVADRTTEALHFRGVITLGKMV